MLNRKMSVFELCCIGIFTAVIAVCAQISIPMPIGVPMTMQTFAIPLAGIVLGKKNGTLATLVYVLLGLIGVPVFAGLTGGLGIVFGKTGGFILSFPLMAFTAGIGEETNSKVWQVIWLVIGAAINYVCGMLMFSVITSMDLATSFTLVVVPFIPTAVIKIVLVFILGARVRSAFIRKSTSF